MSSAGRSTEGTCPVPFAGQWVARRSSYRYRVRYRIDEGARTVVVLGIQGRADAYRSSGYA